MKTILFLLVAAQIYAVTPACPPIVNYEHVVFASTAAKYGVTPTDFKRGKKLFSQTDGQGGLLFSIYLPPCTNYWTVWISTDKESDNTFLNNANVKKAYYTTKRRYLTKTNGIVEDCVDILRDYPKDYNVNYALHESTP